MADAGERGFKAPPEDFSGDSCALVRVNLGTGDLAWIGGSTSIDVHEVHHILLPQNKNNYSTMQERERAKERLLTPGAVYSGYRGSAVVPSL